MYEVELTHRTKLGGLSKVIVSTSQTVSTIDEAHELRRALQIELTRRGIDGRARVLLKNARPLPTTDEAMEHFCKHLAEFPPAAEPLKITDPTAFRTDEGTPVGRR